MSPIALYFASGESLYSGTAMLLLVIIASQFPRWTWLLRFRNAMTWVALAFIAMASPPLAISVDLIFFAAFTVWFVTSNCLSATPVAARFQRTSTIVLVFFLLYLTTTELTHRRMPTITGDASDQLVVIGDSISSGLDPRFPAWPLVLQQACGVQVKSLAKPGAQVGEALLLAKSLTDGDRIVLIEIGGNDLLMGTSADEYGKDLEALLSRVSTPNRLVLMFELPLLPNKIAFGRIQRRLSAKYRVPLIPKRYFSQVIGDANATTDGLHLSPSGARHMAALVTQVLSQVLACPRPSNPLGGALTL